MTGPQTKIESISIKGFRSLADVSVSDLPNVTVMIGANGSGKSNIFRFFEMLHWMLRLRRLADFVARNGGADDQLCGGIKTSSEIESTVRFKTGEEELVYRFELSFAQPDRLVVTLEYVRYDKEGQRTWEWHSFSNMRSESGILEDLQAAGEAPFSSGSLSTMMRLLSGHQAHHFRDTSDTSSMKTSWDFEDNHRLHGHGGNLAAVLYRLEQEDLRRFDLICRHIGRILPEFDRFVIEESYGKVLLRWKAKWSDKTFGAHLTSDGSLRFFALVTLLNLPPEMLPSVILLDEPELGLHPAAIGLVAGMIEQLSHDRQIIVATQSPLLVDEFELDEIMVLDLEDGRTKLRKLNADDYRVWLEQDYTPSQLWQKNLLGGRP